MEGRGKVEKDLVDDEKVLTTKAFKCREDDDAERFTEELALYCLTNQRPTRLGFNVTGDYNEFTGKLNRAYIFLDNANPFRAVPNLGEWVVVYEDGGQEVFSDDAVF